ncbi:MAG TPA: glycoside hydrolase family 32 protein [Blastocatellia bacterium]|nr:glycoside hydrolase family 32 protein [Blastocatellia bacterium]
MIGIGANQMNEIQLGRFMKPRRCVAGLMAVVIVLVLILGTGPTMSGRPTRQMGKVSDAVSYKEAYRPQFHFTPERNWMNDPNGLVYFDGEYHLFYQYNPFGDKWGHMSWGHAVSKDLVHWRHLPVALPEEDGVMIFSGSAVVDEKNTSGFGQGGKPAMVAIYTGYHPSDGRQDQRIAYSADGGRTWTKYSGNPVLDIKSTDFRDPKVFWHEPDKRWIMAAALAAERKVSFYASADLKRWTHLSDFGPAGAIGGAWECPDLFELPVDGKPGLKKWGLIVNLNPGGVAGGSGAQYFVGSFDGKRFSSDEKVTPLAAPDGDTVADFEGASYGGWTATGTAFGGGPARARLDGKEQVVGAIGASLASSAAGGDDAQGTLTSPAFRVSRNYINFLVGGGNRPNELAVNLMVNGEVVRTATGATGDVLDWVVWDARPFAGKEAQIQIIDRGTGREGHILVDHVVLSDSPAVASLDTARWVDYGKDFYAVVSWSNVPRHDGRRLWIGWMNNWEYGQEIPTSPWRSAQSVPREARLKTYSDGIHLMQSPVVELQRLRRAHYRLSNQVIAAGSDPLSRQRMNGKTLEIIATFEPGTASEFGLKVRKGAKEETVVGYDVKAAELFVDRSRSGKVEFNPRFPGRHGGPLPTERGRIKLHLFVDWSSVEVFGNDGLTVITDQIFPSADSDGLALYAKGGAARLISLDVWVLRSASVL